MLAGERFVVSADGGRARITRLSDGQSLRVRIAIAQSNAAWAVVEDDEGHWQMPAEHFDRYRLREEGPITSAALVPLSESAPGYNPQLVERFFAAPRPSPRR